MDFSWSREEEDFRQEIRDFLKREVPAGWNDTLVLDKESERVHSTCQRIYPESWCQGLAGGALASRIRRPGVVFLAVFYYE